ncbi:mitogen-activated protein kinase kinase kinase 20-like [Hevea brasiliensis]|uniref:mitogen-activated protein kinase kinase kinase 20-like n=1 Tax=Hevea brasiliensis TaxID=3981 RepID=UPI0025F39B94|nr:mitogen-activated protein kinase kinase kinase 20-like [Hevea brasiliensis]
MDWVRGKCLGKGSYGSVFLAIQTNIISPLLAVKSALIIDSFSIMIIYNLLLEYAPGGSLADLINKYGGKIPECDVRRYTRMILKGLSSIHNNGYVHCGLKPAKIIVFPSDQQDFQLKVADFGLAKEPDEDNLRKFFYQYTFRGTPLYMSSESVKLAEISPALDFWSLGCIVIEMITGKSPWHELVVEDILVRLAFEGSSPEIPESMSKKGKDFLRICFMRPHCERWTANMLLDHPFIVDEELTSPFEQEELLPPSLSDDVVKSMCKLILSDYSPGQGLFSSADRPLSLGSTCRRLNFGPIGMGCKETEKSLLSKDGLRTKVCRGSLKNLISILIFNNCFIMMTNNFINFYAFFS